MLYTIIMQWYDKMKKEGDKNMGENKDSKADEFFKGIDQANGSKDGQSSINFKLSIKGVVSADVKVYINDSEQQLIDLRVRSFKLFGDIRAEVERINGGKQ